MVHTWNTSSCAPGQQKLTFLPTESWIWLSAHKGEAELLLDLVFEIISVFYCVLVFLHFYINPVYKYKLGFLSNQSIQGQLQPFPAGCESKLRHRDIYCNVERHRFHCNQNAFHVQKEIYRMASSELGNIFFFSPGVVRANLDVNLKYIFWVLDCSNPENTEKTPAE